MRKFTDNDVISQLSGHCRECREPLTQILVLIDGRRLWIKVTWCWRANSWLEHQCPKQPDSINVVRRAA